jgi:ubiquinone/menaquinone biosynthesis C-methylase UbiE
MSDPYHKHAVWYDTFVEPFITGVRRKSLDLHPPASGLNVLEVGCGTGTNLVPHKRAGSLVCGIDRSPSMIAQAQRKLNGQADLRVGDASRMPYSNDRFDLIVAMFTLHEMPPDLRPLVMREMIRVVKPHGRMLLVDYQTGPLVAPWGWIEKGVAFTFERLAGGDHYKNYCDFMNRKGLPSLLRSQHLSVKRRAAAASGNIALYLVGK